MDGQKHTGHLHNQNIKECALSRFAFLAVRLEQNELLQSRDDIYLEIIKSGINCLPFHLIALALTLFDLVPLHCGYWIFPGIN